MVIRHDPQLSYLFCLMAEFIGLNSQNELIYRDNSSLVNITNSTLVRNFFGVRINNLLNLDPLNQIPIIATTFDQQFEIGSNDQIVLNGQTLNVDNRGIGVQVSNAEVSISELCVFRNLLSGVQIIGSGYRFISTGERLRRTPMELRIQYLGTG